MRNRKKKVPSITRVSILKGASDITRVSSFLSSKLLVVFALTHLSEPKREELISKETSTFHPYQFSVVKQWIKCFEKMALSFTSIILFLLDNLKLPPFVSKLCIFCFFILSSNFFGVAFTFLDKFFTSSTSNIR